MAHRCNTQRRSRRFGKKRQYEWLGFRDGGAAGNLDTSTVFELIPPSGASSVVINEFMLHRVVGMMSFSNQGSVTATTHAGAVLQQADVGGDQVIDDGVPPLTTDLDEFANPGILWWQTWGSITAPVAAADYDTTALHVPLDVKGKRRFGKRKTLILRVDAATTARLKVAVNVRVLIEHFG